MSKAAPQFSALLLSVLCCLSLSSAPIQVVTADNVGPPAITKMDPPNWWTSFSPQLMLMLKGHDLGGARVSTSFPGVSARGAKASVNGHYLFVWLTIAAETQPGDVPLHVQTNYGGADVKLALLAHSRGPGSFQGLSKDDVIYLIMPDRFADGDPANDKPPGSAAVYDRNQPRAWHGGDLRGVREHLGYLRDLGATAVWLTPIWKNSDGGYHGYHPVDMYAVDPHMGSLRDYQDLAKQAHALGIKLVMDFVANHVGPDHPWVADPPIPTWFHGTPDHHSEATYNFSSLIDPHAPPRQARSVIEGWFANLLPDLNTDDPDVAQYLVQNALWWIEISGLDAIRLDTFPYSSRRFWANWHRQLRQAHPGFVTIAEVSDQDTSTTAFFQGGRPQWDGVDAGATTVFDYPLYYRVRDVVLRRRPIQQIIDTLQLDWLYSHPDLLVPFIGNHDTSRFMGEPGSSREKLIAASALLLTFRGIPEIYYGDEIGMAGGEDPDNRRDFTGGFPGDTRDAFTAAARTPAEQDIFRNVQELLRLRHDHPALRQGQQRNIGWDENYYAYVRATPQETMLVVLNNAPTARNLKISLQDTLLEGAQNVRLAFGNAPAQLHGNTFEVTLSPNTVAVYTVQIGTRPPELRAH